MVDESLIDKIRKAGGYGQSGHMCRTDEVIDIVRKHLEPAIDFGTCRYCGHKNKSKEDIDYHHCEQGSEIRYIESRLHEKDEAGHIPPDDSFNKIKMDLTDEEQLDFCVSDILRIFALGERCRVGMKNMIRPYMATHKPVPKDEIPVVDSYVGVIYDPAVHKPIDLEAAAEALSPYLWKEQSEETKILLRTLARRCIDAAMQYGTPVFIKGDDDCFRYLTAEDCKPEPVPKDEISDAAFRRAILETHWTYTKDVHELREFLENYLELTGQHKPVSVSQIAENLELNESYTPINDWHEECVKRVLTEARIPHVN